MMRLDQNGISIMKNYGSYSKYCSLLQEKQFEKSQQNEIEKSKLWYESENARIAFEDYPRLKGFKK
jgi:hypothetical protein